MATFHTAMPPSSAAAAKNLPHGEYCTIENAALIDAQDNVNASDQSVVFKTTTELLEGYASCESEAG